MGNIIAIVLVAVVLAAFIYGLGRSHGRKSAGGEDTITGGPSDPVRPRDRRPR